MGGGQWTQGDVRQFPKRVQLPTSSPSARFNLAVTKKRILDWPDMVRAGEQ